MKGDNGRSIGSSGRFSNSMLTNLPRCTMSLLRTIIATISTPSASANDQLAGWRNETIGALVFPRADQHWICATLLLLQFRTARQSMLHYALLLLRRLNATAGFGTRLLDSAKSCAKFSSARDPPNL